MAILKPAVTLEQLETIHDALKRQACYSLLEDPGWICICVVDHRLTELQLCQLEKLRLAGHPLAVRTVIIHANLYHSLYSRAPVLRRHFTALDGYLSSQGAWAQ